MFHTLETRASLKALKMAIIFRSYKAENTQTVGFNTVAVTIKKP